MRAARLLLACAAGGAHAGWPAGAQKDFENQVWWEDWQTTCQDHRNSVVRTGTPPNDANGHPDTAKAKCGYDCREIVQPSGCRGNCGNKFCTGWAFDDWNTESKAKCSGTWCPEQPAAAPAPCKCQTPYHCSSWGDPHMSDWTGWKWEFHGNEEHEVYGRAGGIHLTNKNWKCNGGEATCMERFSLWSEEWEGTMGGVEQGGGSAEVHKDGVLYVGCIKQNTSALAKLLPWTIPGTKGQLVLTTFSRPDGEWVDSSFTFRYTAGGNSSEVVEVRVDAPIGKWTTSAYIKVESGCLCGVTGLCNGPYEVHDCLKEGQPVPAGCGAIPPASNTKRLSGLCVRYDSNPNGKPPTEFPPRDCKSRSVLKEYDYCCAKFSAGKCGTRPAPPDSGEEVPSASFYEQCLLENCQLNPDGTQKYCLSQVDKAAAEDKSGDCPPQPPSPACPPEVFEPPPVDCAGSWTACDATCKRKWEWRAATPSPNCSQPTEPPSCAPGDGACPKAPAPPDAPPKTNCSDGARGDSELGVDCGGPCPDNCVPCTPARAATEVVDGVDCGVDETCVRVTLSPPMPPTGSVHCQAPCDATAADSEMCTYGTVDVLKPGKECGGAGADEVLVQRLQVYAKGDGEKAAGGVGALKSKVGKLSANIDLVTEGQPTVCFTAPAAERPVQEAPCVDCAVDWVPDAPADRPPGLPDGYRPTAVVVEKRNNDCVERQENVGVDGSAGTYSCDVVVTVRDADVAAGTTPAGCKAGADAACGFIDIVAGGKSCGTTEADAYVTRSAKAVAVSGRGDLRRAMVDSAKMKRKFDPTSDHVCWRARISAAPQGLQTCTFATDSSQQLCENMKIGSEGTDSDDGLSGGAIAGIVIGVLVGVAIIAGVAFMFLKGGAAAGAAGKASFGGGFADAGTARSPSPGSAGELKEMSAPLHGNSGTPSPKRVVNVNCDQIY